MRLELLHELLEITKHQEELIAGEEVEAYIELIDKRQLIMDQIDQINESNPQVLDTDERNILLQIKEIDDKNNREFQVQLEKVKNQLKQVRMNMQRANQYNNPYGGIQEEGLFIDKRNGIMRRR